MRARWAGDRAHAPVHTGQYPGSGKGTQLPRSELSGPEAIGGHTRWDP